jgi:hypothetical protein
MTTYNGKQYDDTHGSFFDRGAADSYYHRPPRPHRGGVSAASGPERLAETAEEVAEYEAGYAYNHAQGDFKQYE